MASLLTFPGPYARVTGWGKCLPARIVDNFELEKTLPTNDEWIFTRTGIKQRRIAAPDETPSSLGAGAARQALERAGLDPRDIDLIIVATSSPEAVMPATAALIQRSIGAGRAAAFDVNAACSGGMYALAVAAQFIHTGVYRNALVVGTEVYSRLLDWTDRATCILFGDGAGALVLQASDTPGGMLSCVLGNDTAGADYIVCTGVMSRSPLLAVDGPGYLTMNGPAVFKLAVRTMAEASRTAIADAGLCPDDIDLFIPHQANLRIITAVAGQMGLPLDRIYTNVEKYGNTAAASVPIAICEAAETGRLVEGSRLVMVAAGSGFSYGALAAQWTAVPQPVLDGHTLTAP